MKFFPYRLPQISDAYIGDQNARKNFRYSMQQWIKKEKSFVWRWCRCRCECVTRTVPYFHGNRTINQKPNMFSLLGKLKTDTTISGRGKKRKIYQSKSIKIEDQQRKKLIIYRQRCNGMLTGDDSYIHIMLDFIRQLLT